LVNIALSAVSARRARFSSQWLVITAFLAPSLLLLAVFLLYPLISSLRLSFVDWNGLGNNARFTGLTNWVALAHDMVFWRALANNAILALTSVVIELPVALALAVLIEKAGRGSRMLKILYFLPLLMSSVAIGVLFKNVYDPNFGPLNVGLRALGLDALAQDWLGDAHYSLGATIAVVCWQNVPFYMILFLAGLSSMSAELPEAARLDGASEWTIFWRIKLPHLQGTVRTAVLLSVLGSLRYFDLIYVMTGGGPEGASEVMATYMYRTVFSSFQLGYGSTIGTAMFAIVFLVAIVAMRISRRYATEI
jgi:raffinose/stachyose/melibiose transport system permease protein